MSETECIRCDEPTAAGYPAGGPEYELLTAQQETVAFAICAGCFEEVRDRDLWARY